MRAMKLHYAIALLLASVSTLPAQTGHPVLRVPPALMVQEDGRATPLGLTKLQTEVRILGPVAETTTTMTFTNPSQRAMEGDLYFPLPEGATISGYALDINGTMVDGVAVEKHEARRVFEEVVRRGVDPGLVQWTQGNNFQTRVFPIPARGSRTVRVSYVSELIGGKEAPAYHLPLKFKDKIHEFSLRVEVVKPAAEPQVTKGELANFAFQKWHESFVAETKQQDWSPVEDLVIALPKVDGPQVVVEKADDGQTYFAVQDIPAGPREAWGPVSEPRHVVIYWDASGSRASDHAREIALLRGYFQQWWNRHDSRSPDSHVDLVLLRNAASKPQQFLLEHEADLTALVTALEKVQYDGGTQLGAIAPLASGGKPDFYLVFTDGISNFGSEQPAPLDAPAYVFSADAGANYAFLQSLAESNGGQYFNLAIWKDADVLTGIGRPAWSFLSAASKDVQVKEIYPQLPQPVAGRRFRLVGKLTDDAATVTVNYGFPGGVPEKRTFQVSRADAVEGLLLRRLWAQKKLAHLMVHQKANEKEIAALGKQYGLVTPYTSLLVLDSLEQYVQYEIAPPKSLASMREEYMRRIDTVEHQKQKQKADKLYEVVRMWDERVNWWNAEFKYEKDFKYKGGQEGEAMGRLGPAAPGGFGGGGGGTGGMSMRGAQRPMAEPAADAPAPPAAAAAPAEPAPVPDRALRQLTPERLSTRDAGHAAPSQELLQEEQLLPRAGQPQDRQPGIVIKPKRPST
jgi:hypothetical protein